MTDTIPEDELHRIVERTANAYAAMGPPWTAWLETREAVGGCSVIQAGKDESDDELYLDLHLGPERVQSPDPRLDALIDFIAHAPSDVTRLLAEVRRLKAT